MPKYQRLYGAHLQNSAAHFSHSLMRYLQDECVVNRLFPDPQDAALISLIGIHFRKFRKKKFDGNLLCFKKFCFAYQGKVLKKLLWFEASVFCRRFRKVCRGNSIVRQKTASFFACLSINVFFSLPNLRSKFSSVRRGLKR